MFLQVMYSFSSQTASQFGTFFDINAESGEVSLLSRPRYEFQQTYNLLVQARDAGPDPFLANAWVTVNIVDVNDHAPIISITSRAPSGRLELSEEDQIGTTIAYISGHDADTGSAGRVSCSVNGTSFALQSVDASEFALINRVMFNREETPWQILNVTCVDAGRPPQASSLIIAVEIGDENDNAPKFMQQGAYTARIEEGRTTKHLLAVNATDADIGANGFVRYYIFGSGDQYFTVEERTGVIGVKVVCITTRVISGVKM